MSFISGLEGGLEKYIEGFFRDKFKGRVQPLDIAKKLAREMRDRKRVSVNLVYAPNEYDVYLHPEDLSTIAYLSDALSLELQDYLGQKAIDKEFTLVAPARVRFLECGDLKPGQVRVSGRFGSPGETAAGGGEQGSSFEDTLSYRPVRDTAPVPVVSQSLRYSLQVAEGSLAGKIFRLEGPQVVVGRRESCDIALSDGSISRRHAMIELQKGNWLLTDLDSTNGTFVNGVRISTKVLEPGDTVKFGATLCAFKVD